MSTTETGPATAAESSSVVLVGNPNVGKSVLFGLLTRTYVTVSNYPGTTVEIVRGIARSGSDQVEVVDTPGVNNLLPESEDEQVTRDVLLGRRPRCVVQVADAKNLCRSLLITMQLAEMGLPLVLDLNMLDEARTRGIEVDADELSRLLGVPVVSTVATRRQGLGALRRAIEGGGTVPVTDLVYDDRIEKAIGRIVPLLPEELPVEARSLALMILARDPSHDARVNGFVPEEHREEIDGIVRDLAASHPLSIPYAVTLRRYAAAQKIIDRVYRSDPEWRGLGQKLEGIHRRRGGRTASRALLALSTLLFFASLFGVPGLGSWAIATFAAVGMVAGGVLTGTLTSVGWGLLPAAGILYLMYLFVGDFGAGTAVDWLESTVFGEWISPVVTGFVDGLLGTDGLGGFFRDFVVGEYGAVTMALAYALAIILPIVGTFFLAFGLLEDSGYLPRLAVMMNRLFTAMGLNGKAVLPMILGLGCDTMATLTARILPTRKERVIVTLLLALAVPCSAQLGIILGILAGISFAGALWWMGSILLVIFVVGRLAAKVLPGSTGDFLLELPPIRVPKISNVVRKTFARLEWYAKEAVPLFFLGTAVLFVLDKVGALTVIIDASRPLVVGFLGLPEGMASVFLMGFLRRDYGAAGLLVMWDAGGLTPVQAVVALTTITLFIPCLAQWFVMLKERGWRMTLAATAFILPFALLVGGAMNGLLRLLNVTFDGT